MADDHPVVEDRAVAVERLERMLAPILGPGDVVGELIADRPAEAEGDRDG